jgi:DNA-directed RNA polymerase subunit K/omega
MEMDSDEESDDENDSDDCVEIPLEQIAAEVARFDGLRLDDDE